MKTRFFFVFAFFAMLLALPVQGWADENDWTLSSSLTPTSYDSATRLVINASRCSELFNISTKEVSFFFTLSSDVTLDEDAQYSIKFAHGNETCDEKSLEKAPEDMCKSVVTMHPLTASMSPIGVTLSVDELGTPKSSAECENLSETSYIYLIVENTTGLTKKTYTVKYLLDFRTGRPEAPKGITASAGGESIKVSWEGVSGIEDYKVYYGKEGANPATGMKPEELSGMKSAPTKSTSINIKDGVSSDTIYMIAVTSIDENGNESLVGEVTSVETVAADDFWETYRKENQDVDGGFCFIATAAYGSTQEPHVQILRKFRDQVLLQSAPGKKFVETYYRMSPPLAHFIGQHPTLRAMTRVLLWPVYGFAYARLYAPVALYAGLSLLLLGIGFAIYRRYRRKSLAKSAVKAAAILFAVSTFGAGMVAMPQTASAESPVNMMFEFKAGIYRPDNLGEAYKAHFGSDSNYLVEGEFDYQLWRGVGSVAIGASLGYGAASGKGIEKSTGEKSVDTTELHWLPLRLSVIYRFDYLWVRFHVPLTIYGKFGFDYAFWWVNDGSDSVAKSSDGKEGYGGTFGFHAAAGIAFVLDWLAPEMEKSIDVEWGINNSYIFAEYMYVRLDNFGSKKAFDLTDDAAFLFGLGLEF